jgi:glycerophosphoryl diester phosphodiesterase
MPESPFSQRALLAHRGASATEAENTVVAFERAIAAGADAVELDVRLSADGHPIVLHDLGVDRMTDGHGLVGDLTLSELKRLRIRTSDGDAAEIPTLREALALCLGRVAVDVEIKNIPGEPDFEADGQGVVDATIRNIEAVGGAGSVLLSSFNPWALERARELAPDIPTGLLTDPSVEAAAALAFARQQGSDWVLPPIRRVEAAGEGFVADAHAAGISVGTWNTDDPTEAVALFRIGVDAVATNDPEAVVPAVRELLGM